MTAVTNLFVSSINWFEQFGSQKGHFDEITKMSTFLFRERSSGCHTFHCCLTSSTYTFKVTSPGFEGLKIFIYFSRGVTYNKMLFLPTNNDPPGPRPLPVICLSSRLSNSFHLWTCFPCFRDKRMSTLCAQPLRRGNSVWAVLCAKNKEDRAAEGTRSKRWESRAETLVKEQPLLLVSSCAVPS